MTTAMLHRSRSQQGWSLTEVLVVVAIIAVLLALLIPTIQVVRTQARKTVCLGNLRQLAVGYLQYAVDNRACPVQTPLDAQQANYFLSERPDALATNPLQLMGLGLIASNDNLPPPVLYCPSNTFGNYRYNSAANPAAVPFYPINVRLRAGYALCWGVRWGQPTPAPSRMMSASTAIITDVCDVRAIMLYQHRTGANTVYGDGHARWVAWSGIASAYGGIPWSGISLVNNPAMQAYSPRWPNSRQESTYAASFTAIR